MIDVWTSGGVIVGVSLVSFTGWLWLDAAVAIAVGLHILLEGARLVRSSAHGLMDAALTDHDMKVVRTVLERLSTEDLAFTNLRTRRAGSCNFVYLDVLVPGQWTVLTAHRLLDQIEQEIAIALPETYVFTHAEPLPAAAEGGREIVNAVQD